MPSFDVRGHLVPNGSEPASRQSLLDFSRSIPSLKACASSAAATQYVNSLKAAGVKATDANPVFVWRTDLKALLVWDGLNWSGTSRLHIKAQQYGDSGLSYTQPDPHEVMILQTGRIAGFTTDHNFGNGYLPVQEFPEAFPKACMSITFQPIYNNASGWQFVSPLMPMVDRLTKESFRVLFPGEARPAAHALMWQAIGY